VVDGLHDQLARLDARAAEIVEGGSWTGTHDPLFGFLDDGHDDLSCVGPPGTARCLAMLTAIVSPIVGEPASLACSAE
jgi:hypothetical protein